MTRAPQDPYSPPPRHRDGSGAVVRFALIAAMLGAGAWGYMAYRDQPQTALTPPAQTQDLADRTYDAAPSGEPAVPAEPAKGDPPA